VRDAAAIKYEAKACVCQQHGAPRDLEARSNPEKVEINAPPDALLIDGIAQVERKRTNTFIQIRGDC
jgi:hypothetical protein